MTVQEEQLKRIADVLEKLSIKIDVMFNTHIKANHFEKFKDLAQDEQDELPQIGSDGDFTRERK